jgi:hypothetical protein
MKRVPQALTCRDTRRLYAEHGSAVHGPAGRGDQPGFGPVSFTDGLRGSFVRGADEERRGNPAVHHGKGLAGFQPSHEVNLRAPAMGPLGGLEDEAAVAFLRCASLCHASLCHGVTISRALVV